MIDGNERPMSMLIWLGRYSLIYIEIYSSYYLYNNGIVVTILYEDICEGKDKSVIISDLLSKNIIVDNMIKLRLPHTWNTAKQQPKERTLSFICSIINMHISIT